MQDESQVVLNKSSIRKLSSLLQELREDYSSDFALIRKGTERATLCIANAAGLMIDTIKKKSTLTEKEFGSLWDNALNSAREELNDKRVTIAALSPFDVKSVIDESVPQTLFKTIAQIQQSTDILPRRPRPR